MGDCGTSAKTLFVLTLFGSCQTEAADAHRDLDWQTTTLCRPFEVMDQQQL